LLPALFIWYRRLDKKLVLTSRVKRFFLVLAFFTVVIDLLCFTLFKCQTFGVLIPLALATGVSMLYEKILFNSFKKEAGRKLSKISPKIIAITASYGKTSIKNFTHHIIKDSFKAYKTPRSVNTLAGLIKDINIDMPNNIEIYIAEAGARETGDIDEIAKFLNHNIAVVGKIGPAHIEYFKSLENIRDTKMEILNSQNLDRAFVHISANVDPKENKRVTIFGDDIKIVSSNLDGISFCIDNEEYFAPVLGEFNAINITVAILISLELGIDRDVIKQRVSTIPQVEHRLQKIESGGKIIIDDSFNGNLEGMSSSYELMSSYQGRKVIITPGIVESTDEANIQLAQKIDRIFDLVIITGLTNSDLLDQNIINTKKIILKDKRELEDTLANSTFVGDLILFSNDTPTFM
jgi:UDP-N-acetylmuramoyl-tripeptide--D-alanyl-D-alanine ligase